MSASGGQSIDELIMCLVGMGFDLEDSQQAIIAGKLSVEDAIEWILSGKPQPPATQSSSNSGRLTLHTANQDSGSSIGSNPFSNPQPLLDNPSGRLETASTASARANMPSSTGTAREPADGDASEDSAILSRLRMSEEQRLIKEKFEEKQREEARKRIRQEKLASKQAHAQILKEIEKDREVSKIKRPAASERETSPAKAPPSGKMSEASASVTGASQENKAKKCLIQIRLPDGQALRQSFSSDSTLQEVWNFVASKYRQCNNMVLMQPFPREEYGEDKMLETLESLRLMPSGSLVLKKMEAPQTKPTEEPMDVEREPGDGEEVAIHPEADAANQQFPGHAMPPYIPHEPPPPTSHKWGTGQKLGEEEQEMEQLAGVPAVHHPAMEVFDNDEDEGSDEDEDMPAGGFPPGPGWPGMPHHQPGHQWGDGQLLAGQVFHPENMPHHKRTPKQLAADAAASRFALKPADDSTEGATPAPSSLRTVAPLVQLIIRHVSSRICDSRTPIVGLQGLPTNLAMNLLEYLISERQLKPKTLHPFVSCHLRQLVLDSYPYTTNELLSALRLHTYLSHLSLAACPLITDKGLAPLIALKRLKHLNLRGCRQLTNGCIHVISEYENLVTLILENTGINDSGIQILAEKHPGNIQHLNLNRTDVTHHVLTLLKDLPQLKSLSLEYSKVASLSGVQGLPGLESLSLSGTSIVTDSLLCLASHPSLTALNIANTPNMEGDLALQYIAGLKLQLLQLPSRLSTTDTGMQYLTRMPLLTLDLTNYIHVGDEGVRHICQIHRNLEELYVDRTAVSDLGAAVIGAFTQLHELSLSETRISNHFLKGGSLANCTVLSKVNLSKTAVSSKGMKYLRLPSLILLNLDSTRVRPEMEEVLLSNCPNLRRISLANVTPLRESEEEDV